MIHNLGVLIYCCFCITIQYIVKCDFTDGQKFFQLSISTKYVVAEL